MQSSATHLRGQEWASGQGGARTALGWDCQPAASCSSWRRTALWQEACWGRCRRPGTRERDRGVGLAWGQRDGEEGPVASQRSPASLGPKRQWNGCEEIRGQGGRRKRTPHPPTPRPLPPLQWALLLPREIERRKPQSSGAREESGCEGGAARRDLNQVEGRRPELLGLLACQALG